MTCEGGRAGNWHHVPRLGSGRSTVHCARRRDLGGSGSTQPLPAPPLNSGTEPTSAAEGPPPPGRPRGRRRAWAAGRAPARPRPPAAHLPLPPCLRGPTEARPGRLTWLLPRSSYPGRRSWEAARKRRSKGGRGRRDREGKRRCSRGGGGSRQAGDQKKGETTPTRRPPAQTLKSGSGARSPAGSDGGGAAPAPSPRPPPYRPHPHRGRDHKSRRAPQPACAL